MRFPFKDGFRSILYVAEDHRSTVCGLAMLDHDADLNFCYLDYLASDKKLAGRGVGGALYDRIRSEALALGAVGVFLECLPDDPLLCRDPDILKQNVARLKFYEAYGARPIINTAYETPVHPEADNPPYIVFDGLAQGSLLRRTFLKRVIARILAQNYGDICGPDYVRMVLGAIREDPVQLRPWRYAAAPVVQKMNASIASISPRSLW